MKTIDKNTLVLDGVDIKDHPDYVDAYISEGYYMDGTAIPDEVLDQFNNDHPEIAQGMAFESLL